MTANYPDSPTAAGLGGDVDTSSSSGAKGQAKQAAGTAADEGKHVAGAAQGEAQKVASEAKSQVTGLLSQATSQVEDQSRTQRDRLVETLRSFGDDLEQMATNGESGMASDLAREVADRARGLSTHLDGREPRDLVDDLRHFARRKTGAFLVGALAAGVVAGRLTRGAKDAKSDTAGSTSPGGRDYAGQPAVGMTTAPSGGASDPTSYGSGTVEGSGLPHPGGSVAGDASWTDTRAREDLS